MSELTREDIDRTIKMCRGALKLLAADRHRVVLHLCPNCWHEICDNDIAAHVCPPRPDDAA